METVTYKHDIIGYKNFVPAEDLPKIIAYFESMGHNWGDVAFRNSLGMGIPPIDSLALNYGLAENYFEKIREKYQNAVETTHGRKVKPNTTHAQKWEVGGIAHPHSDNSDFAGNPNAFEINKYVGILYLNDDYEGGELYFPDHGIVLKPEAGMFVTFPGGHENIHGVTEVTKGTRYTMVSFWDYAEAEYSEERKAEWEVEIKGIREKQAKDKERWDKEKPTDKAREMAIVEAKNGSKRLYFLHIQKTGGRDLINRMFVNDEILYSYLYGYRSHTGKLEHDGFDSSLINQNTLVFTTLRDPISRGVSHYVSDISLRHGELKPESEIDFSLLNFDSMWDYLINHPNMSKFMTISIFEAGKDNILEIAKSKEPYLKTHEEIDNQLKKINKLIKLESFSPERFTQLRKEFHDFAGTEIKHPGLVKTDDLEFYYSSLEDLPVDRFTNTHSKDLYNSLTSDQLNMLKTYYEPDYYVYNKAN